MLRHGWIPSMAKSLGLWATRSNKRTNEWWRGSNSPSGSASRDSNPRVKGMNYFFSPLLSFFLNNLLSSLRFKKVHTTVATSFPSFF